MEIEIDKKIKEVFFEKANIFLSEYVSRRFLKEMKLDVQYDVMTQRLLLGLKAYVWSREVHEQVIGHISYPENWKESLKERFLPSFLKKRYPVKYHRETVKIHHNHMCPHFNLDGLHRHIAFMDMNKPYEYPKIKPTIDVISQMEDMYRDSLTMYRKPVKWKLNPQYYTIFIQECTSISLYARGPNTFLGLPVEVTVDVEDIYLVEDCS